MANKELINLLADLLFAYVNKDSDDPHDFEIEAVSETCKTLLREYSGGKYTDHFLSSVLKRYDDK